MKLFLPVLLIAALPVSATAQQAGSTYPNGSNLPQRSAGEVAPKTTGAMNGSVSPNTAATVNRKAAQNSRTKSQRIHRTHKTPSAKTHRPGS